MLLIRPRRPVPGQLQLRNLAPDDRKGRQPWQVPLHRRGLEGPCLPNLMRASSSLTSDRRYAERCRVHGPVARRGLRNKRPQTTSFPSSSEHYLSIFFSSPTNETLGVLEIAPDTFAAPFLELCLRHLLGPPLVEPCVPRWQMARYNRASRVESVASDGESSDGGRRSDEDERSDERESGDEREVDSHSFDGEAYVNVNKHISH